jgi:hypothetical protein
MSNIRYIQSGAKARRRRNAPPTGAEDPCGERRAGRWRVVAALAGIGLLYVVGLLVAVTIGSGAVAVTILLAVTLAMFVGPWSQREPDRIERHPASKDRSC